MQALLLFVKKKKKRYYQSCVACLVAHDTLIKPYIGLGLSILLLQLTCTLFFNHNHALFKFSNHTALLHADGVTPSWMDWQFQYFLCRPKPCEWFEGHMRQHEIKMINRFTLNCPKRSLASCSLLLITVQHINVYIDI